MAARNRPRTILSLPRMPRGSREAATMNPLLDPKLVDLLEGRDRHSRTPRTLTVTPPGEGGGDSGGDERWRFQAEMLRAECNFLRMEREVALRKLERNRAQMEDTLRSAMDTLVLGRKKIDWSESESVDEALDASIEELEERLEVLRLGNGGCGRRSKGSSRGMHPRSSGRRNFDRQASVLRRPPEKMEDDLSVKDIQEISVPDSRKKAAESERIEAAESASSGSSHGNQFPNETEMLQRKMDGLSRGMLERIEECSHFLSANDGSIITSSNKGERNDPHPIGCATAIKKERFLQIQKQPPLPDKPEKEKMGLLSCCNCKELVSHIMQQVRAESEQWTEMQEMLDQVRVEMEELKSSRDHWQRRAISSEVNFHSQRAHKLEWKQKARSSERKVIELQKLLKELQKELQPLRIKLLNAPPSSPMHSEFQPGDPLRRIAQNQQIKSLDPCKEKEKHILVCHMNSQNGLSRRTPLRDINNISPRPRRRV